MRSLSLNRSLKTKNKPNKNNNKKLHESRGILEKKELGGKGKDKRVVSGASSHLIPRRDSGTGAICLQVEDGLENTPQPKPSSFWASALS